MSEHESLVHSRGFKATVLSGVGVGLSAAATLGFANHAHEETTLGAHQVEVTPSIDDYATLEFPGFIKGRMPVDNPLNLGVHVEVTGTNDIDTALHRDALIATQPQGEIDSLKDTVTDLWLESAAKGIPLGLITTAGIGLAWQRKRGEHWEHFEQSVGRTAAAVGTTAVTLMIVSSGNFNLLDGSKETGNWTPVAGEVPILSSINHQVIETIEVDKNSLSDGAMRLVNSAVRAYQEAGPFYDSLVEEANELGEHLRQPQKGEIVVLHVSDRHDNIPMDAVAKAIGDAGGATMVLNTGDDTSVGGDWEAFSLNSLDSTFADYDERIVVPGNHDEGPFVSEYLEERGWHVLDGKVQEIGGINWLGDADPRSSGLGDWVDNKGETISEQAERLASVACKSNETLVIATHTTASAKEALDRGCADLAVGGHTHYQKGPEPVIGQNGETSTTFTVGTTGGAVFAFALTDKIKKDAQVALLTFSQSGEPVAIQPVTVTTGGEIVPHEVYEMQPTLAKERLTDSDIDTLPGRD